MDWSSIAWLSTVATAVAGGAVSLAAYRIASKGAGDERARRRAHALYVASYALMSVSVLLVALRGFVR